MRGAAARFGTVSRRSSLTTVRITAFSMVLVTVAVGAAVHHRRNSAYADGPAAVIVGDSLTGGNQKFIRSELRSAGLGAVRVEGLSARRIAETFEFQGHRDSGIDRIRTLRATGIDPDLWVIQLGTNDLAMIEDCACADRVGFARSLIQRLVDEVGRDSTIAWVTVHDRTRPDVADDFNTAVFLAALDHPRMTMLPWKRNAVDRPEWFLDDVHPNVAGVRALTDMYIDEIRNLLARPFDRDAPQVGLRRAERVAPNSTYGIGGTSRLR